MIFFLKNKAFSPSVSRLLCPKAGERCQSIVKNDGNLAVQPLDVRVFKPACGKLYFSQIRNPLAEGETKNRKEKQQA